MHARTLRIFRLYQLFNGIIFTGPVWAVYLLSRGLTLTQFGLVEAALHVGMLVAQVPTGALADALGRRRLLVAAGFFTAVGELGYVYAPGFGLICLAGGLIATWSRPAAFWLTAICSLIASGIASRLPDDARGSARQGLSVARSGLSALRRSPRLAVLTIAWSIYWAAFTSAWFYAAPLFAERGASDAMLGFALGGGMLVGAGFSWLGGRMHDRTSLTATVGGTSLVAAVALVLGPALPGLALPVLMLLVVAGLPELVYVTLSTYLQHNTRSEYRATSMSIAEGCFSIQMLWLFPLVGYSVQHAGYGTGFALCADLMATGAALFIASQKLPGLEPAPATT